MFSGTHLSIPLDVHADAHGQLRTLINENRTHAAVASVLSRFGYSGGEVSKDDHLYLLTHLSPAGGRSMAAHLVSAMFAAKLIGQAAPEPEPDEPTGPDYPGRPAYNEARELLDSLGAITVLTAGPSEQKQWVEALWAAKVTNGSAGPEEQEFYRWMATNRGLHKIPERFVPENGEKVIDEFRVLEQEIGKWGLSGAPQGRTTSLGAYTTHDANVYPQPGTPEAPEGAAGVINPRIVVYRSRRIENAISANHPTNAAKACNAVADALGIVSIYAGHSGLSSQLLLPNDWRAALGMPIDYGTGTGSGGGSIGIGGARL